MQHRAYSFGYWLRRRRKALDLTQEALAQRVSCSGFSIRKIEADERRPSRYLAERLAVSLAIPQDERRAFLEAARAVRAPDRLVLDARPVPADFGGAAPAPAVPGTGGPVLGAPVLDERPVLGEPVGPGLAVGAVGAAAGNLPLVGRSRELDLLVGLVKRLSEGAGHAVLIEGEPGIGKSRLLREVAREAHARGVQALATKCYEIERATPFQPAIDLVTRALDRVTDAGLLGLPPVSLAELADLVPEIGARFPGLPRLSSEFPEARLARLSRAVDQLLEAQRDGLPAIVIVDDIQWADDASAQVFHYLARQAARRPVLVIYAYRDEELDNDERLARLVQSLRREADARRVTLQRLRPEDTGSLLAALGDPKLNEPGLAERLHRETEGNPFFLISIVQSLIDGEAQLAPSRSGEAGLLPDALRGAVRVRLATVPKEFRTTLEIAAVLGRRFDFDTLLEATREPEAHLLDALDALVRRRLLREEPDGGIYDFTHDKVREVVYRDIGGARRRMLHQAVGEALERRDEGGLHERDAQIAEQFERAQVWPKALHYLVLAGERSQALFAMRAALDWLDRAVALAELHPEALDEDRRLAIYELRGMARAQAGQTQGAVADIRRVVAAARASGERERTRDALVRLGMAYRRADAYQEATTCLTEALAECRAMGDEHHAADTLYHLGTVAWSSGRNDQAIEHHEEAVGICERRGFDDLVAVQAYHGRGEAHFANAEPVAAIARYTQSLELARHLGDKGYESENLMMIGHACTGTKGLGDYPRTIASFDQALAIARSADLQWHIGPTLLGLDHARACIGHYGQAWNGMSETLHWLEDLNQIRYQMIAHDFMGYLLLDLGLNEDAIARLELGLALGQRTGIYFWRASLEAHLAIARSRMGKKDPAPALLAALEQTLRSSERYLVLRCLDGLAEIALAAGDALGCRAHGDKLLAIARGNGLREMEAGARRWRGQALLAQRSWRAARVELDLAAQIAEEIGRVRLQVDVQAALARLSEAEGRSDSAQVHHAKRYAIAQAIERSLGASGLSAQLHGGR